MNDKNRVYSNVDTSGDKLMKKACVVGGSNGLGLAIAKELINRQYHVYILDITMPDKTVLTDCSSYTYVKYNLLDFTVEPVRNIVCIEELDVLMITAGIGRVAPFDHLSLGEINSVLSVNALATIKILKLFYEKIMNQRRFYCGVMGSIAGLVNSPLFSVYAASKAAICRFVESVNIELECNGFMNRILNVSPGFVGGTKFNGAKHNDYKVIKGVADKILEQLFLSSEMFIPDYETYGEVLARNKEDSHAFGLSSYNYKMSSGRYSIRSGCVGYLSGTFDLFHVGHLNLLRRAKELCDYLVVGVHPDATHKGKIAFIPLEERKEILRGIRYVDEVIDSLPEDTAIWEKLHYNRLFVGSDYQGSERFCRYEEFFSDKDVEIVYFSYTQGTSSTQIRSKILSAN